ncbi:hypothetical protein Dimus_007062 [Dionaea muscipula]
MRSAKKQGAMIEEEKPETVTIRAVSTDEEGQKSMEKVDVDKSKYIEKKLMDKGVQRMDRHPTDGRRGRIGKQPPKSGRGGKYTWEGPGGVVESESDAPVAIDENDPNYVEGDAEVERELRMKGELDEELVIGEVEVPAVVAAEREGVARLVVDPRLSL